VTRPPCVQGEKRREEAGAVQLPLSATAAAPTSTIKGVMNTQHEGEII